MIKLLVKEIKDPLIQENFKRLELELNLYQPMLRGEWQFFIITLTSAVTNFLYPHNLKFMPKDVLQTSITGTGALTWNYAKFDKTNLNITTTGPCVVRAFIGSYHEGSTS